MRILVVDNDTDYLNTYLSGLEKQYVVDIAYNAAEGVYMSEVNDYDVIVVDSGLADMQSHDLCKCTRQAQVKAPIMILSDHASCENNIKSLEAGADLCLYKPINPRELCAHVNALVRRTNGFGTPLVKVGRLSIDVSSRLVKVDDTAIGLRRKEYEILEYLAINAGRIVSKEHLLEHIWCEGIYTCSNVLEVHVRNLRLKIEKPYCCRFIHTVRGFGYKLLSGNI